MDHADKLRTVASLVDSHGRCVTYLRLAITDRCNLRCHYCMPEEGVKVLTHEEILSYEELERLATLFVNLGVRKIRITGGEPFVRKGCLGFMERLIANNKGIDLRLTSNGVLLFPYLRRLSELGIGGLNLSLDTLDPRRFLRLTRRDCFDQVLAVFHEALRLKIPLKVNSVVLGETCDDELVQIATLARDYPIMLRFIELMPFTGSSYLSRHNSDSLEQRLVRLFPGLEEKTSSEIETARCFSVPGYQGTLGIIQGESRRFCSTCNKVRVTSSGMLKNCLYDSGVLDLRHLLRSGATDQEIARHIYAAVAAKLVDGYTAEAARIERYTEDSMATIGG